jgi:hypothetical protein
MERGHMTDDNIIESVAPKQSDKITDAKDAQAKAISDPQRRSTKVKIVGAIDPTQKGVEVVTKDT